LIRLVLTPASKANSSGGGRSDHQTVGFKLSVGDKLFVQVTVGNVDGEHMETPRGLLVGGKGQDILKPTDLVHVRDFADGRMYWVELTATAPGIFNLTLELGLGDISLGDGPKVAGITGEVTV
jgi:hypothetical protein